MTSQATDRTAALILMAICFGLTIVGAGCGSSMSASSGAASSTTSASPGKPKPGPKLRAQQVQQISQTFNGKLRTANIAFSTPTRLRVGNSGLVDLQLSMRVPVDVLRSRLGNVGAKVGAQVLASNTMEASLTGVAFTIQDITAATQAVGPGITEWQWEIMPTRAGLLSLHLALTAFLSLNGTRTDYGVRTFDRTLQVQSVPVAWSTRLTHFLSNNWVWIAGVIAFLAAAVKWFLERQDERRRPGRSQGQHSGDVTPDSDADHPHSGQVRRRPPAGRRKRRSGGRRQTK
jgi:hypothetical protein